MGYVSYAQGFKSGGINMSGLPLNPANLPALSTAVVKPERNATYEIGVKSRLFDNRLTLNVDWFDTTVRAFQANVVDTGPGALRGYLANIDKVRVRGVEADSALALSENLTGFVSASWTEGNYVSYKDGPCPIELIGTTTTVCDLSGKPLPALPKFAASLGGEYDRDTTLFGYPGQVYIHGDATTRSKAYGDPSISNYTVIGGYTLVNATVGFRESQGPWEVFFWAKNIFDRNYMQNLTVQAGNSGLIVGTPNEPRTLGLTVRARF